MNAHPKIGSIALIGSRGETVKLVSAAIVPHWIVRFTFYAMIFSLPFEMGGITLGHVFLPRLLGLLLTALALWQYELFATRPPKAFWCLALYICFAAILEVDSFLNNPEASELTAEMIAYLKTLTQLLVFFWISYNLVTFERIRKGSLLALALSALSLSLLQLFGFILTVNPGDRVTVFGANPNNIAGLVCLGFLALLGLAYGWKEMNTKVRMLAWASSAIMLMSIVRTGSRGNMMALAVAVIVLTVKPESIVAKLKVAIIALMLIGSIAVASYHIEAVRERWERTFYQEDTSGRDIVFDLAWEMFLEKPVIGWGPVIHTHELGARRGWHVLDAHNVYLWILIEAGIVGGCLFFSGLWLILRAAWKARRTSQGTLPLAFMAFLLATAMSTTWLADKPFWFVLSYVLASGTYPSASRANRFLNIRAAADASPPRRDLRRRVG